MNDAQEQQARLVLEHFREDEAWPQRHGKPKRGGMHDASFAGAQTARVLFSVDGRRVALAELDEYGLIELIEIEPAFRRRKGTVT